MKNRLLVSFAPHLGKGEAISRVMGMVTLSLIPSGLAGVFIFGGQALWVIFLGVVSAVVAAGLW